MLWTPLDLPDRWDIGLGFRRVVSRRIAGVMEASTVWEVGPRTPVADAARPVDFLAGVQGHWGRARFLAGLRYHAHATTSGQVLSSPLAGLLDLSGLAETELADYLRSIGAGSVLPHLRRGAQRLLISPASAARSAGAQVVKPSYALRSEHQVGFLILWGWAF